MKSLNPVLHELAGLLRFVGMRDRLRCPRCNAVGTWKPHGYRCEWGERERDRGKVRRWMCKWCGYYVGPEADIHQAYADPGAGCWMLPKDAGRGSTTPAEVVARSSYPTMWPWRG